MEKRRSGRVMRYPVAWITRGSDGWYVVAAALANAILVAGLARLIIGQPVSERRIRLGCLAYAIFGSVTGFVVGDAIRAA